MHASRLLYLATIPALIAANFQLDIRLGAEAGDESDKFCLGSIHTDDAEEWYSFDTIANSSFYNPDVEPFYTRLEDRLTIFSLEVGSRSLIGFLLDATTSPTASGGIYGIACQNSNWQTLNKEDVVLLEDNHGSAASFSFGVLTWEDDWDPFETAGLIVDPMGGILACSTTESPDGIDRTIALLQGNDGDLPVGLISTPTASHHVASIRPWYTIEQVDCELSEVPSPAPTAAPTSEPTRSPTLASTSSPTEKPKATRESRTSTTTVEESPADYSIEFLSAVPRVVPLEGDMVRIAVDNLEADFDLQLLGAEEPVEFEVSEECSEEICVPPGCTCLKFEAPSANTTHPDYVDRSPLVLTATNRDGVSRTSDSIFLRYASTFKCVSAEWSPNGDTIDSCETCPSGGYCPGGNRVWPQRGYWSRSERDLPIPCPNRDACPGVALARVHQRSPSQRRQSSLSSPASVALLQSDSEVDSSSTEVGTDQCLEFVNDECDGVTTPCLCRQVNTEACDEGFAGVACSSCAEGWYANGVANLRCHRCPDSDVQFAELVWLGVIMAVFLLMLAAAIVVLGNRELGTFVSLLIGLQQFFLLSASSSELLGVPASMTQWFGYFSLVNLQIEFFKPGCSNSFDWVVLLWLQLAVVGLAIILFIIAARIRPWFQRFKEERQLTRRIASCVCFCSEKHRRERLGLTSLHSEPGRGGFSGGKPQLKHQGTFRDVTTARKAFSPKFTLGRSLRDIRVAPARPKSPTSARAREPERQAPRAPQQQQLSATEREFDEEASLSSDMGSSASASSMDPPEKQLKKTLTKSKVVFDLPNNDQAEVVVKSELIKPRAVPQEANIATAGAVFRHRAVHSLIILASILYLQLITRAFQGIDCHTPPGFDHAVLYIEQDLECFSTEHYIALIYVAPVVAFSVFFPLWVLWILNRTRTQGVTIERNEQFGFLFRGLKFSGFNMFFRWTVLPLSLVIALQTTFLRDAPLRILLASLVFIFNFGIVASFWPFADWYNNAVQLIIGFAAIVQLLVLLADSGLESLQCHIDITRDPSTNSESTDAVEAVSICGSTSTELLIVSVLLVLVVGAAVMLNVRRKIYTGSFFPAYIPPDAVFASKKSRKRKKSPWDGLTTTGTTGRSKRTSAKARSLFSKMKRSSSGEKNGTRGAGAGASRRHLPAPAISMLSLSNLSLTDAHTLRAHKHVRSMSYSISSLMPQDTRRTQMSVLSVSDLDTLRRQRSVSPSISAQSVPAVARHRKSSLSLPKRAPLYAADTGVGRRTARRASAPGHRSRSPSRSFAFDAKPVADSEPHRRSVPV